MLYVLDKRYCIDAAFAKLHKRIFVPFATVALALNDPLESIWFTYELTG
jgi:hypothetical protein